MNATSRAFLQTLLSTDTALTEPERGALEQVLSSQPANLESIPPMLTVTQKTAAALLSVNRVTIWRMTKDKLLHPVELLPGTLRYPYGEIATLARLGWQGMGSGKRQS